MKKVIFIIAIIALGAAAYLVFKTKGVLPAVLPPVPLSESKGIVNESSLTIAEKFSLKIFAKDLGGVRDLEFSQGGTLIASVPSQGKIISLPDKNGDGKADEARTIIENLSKPHGIAFYKGDLYVAEETRVSKYKWDENGQKASFDKKLFDLPKGERHSTRTITFAKDGKMFVSLGSSCDVCFESEEFIATVIVSDAEGTPPRVFSKGLRNSVFTAINPETGELWATEMGRDFLGDNLPPDEINLLQDGKDYGWPVCYGNKIHDTKFDNRQYVRDPCEDSTPPVYEIPAHSAPLGLQFITSNQFPKDWQGDLLVSYHGSWNRSTPIGYKVVRLDLENGKIQKSEDLITGFLQGSQVVARPVDLVFDQSGSLYISDDKAGFIFSLER